MSKRFSKTECFNKTISELEIKNITCIKEYLERNLPEGTFVIQFKILNESGVLKPKIHIEQVEYLPRDIIDNLAAIFVIDGVIVNEHMYIYYYPNDYTELTELNNLIVNFLTCTMNPNTIKFLSDFANSDKPTIKLLKGLELYNICKDLLCSQSCIRLQDYVTLVHDKVILGNDRYNYCQEDLNFILTSKAIQAAIGYLNVKINTLQGLIDNYDIRFEFVELD